MITTEKSLKTKSDRLQEELASFINADKKAICKAMSILRESDLTAISLRHEQKKSFSEIAALMRKSLSTVRTYHNRGIYQLEREIARTDKLRQV
ncbi:MAG TPA: sigma factor-like helix-turn-helix DNA-binding protein [Puia sp.]|nr:sigma factor-like helix-turn-helix DNA-binding protein [Puia sp.]